NTNFLSRRYPLARDSFRKIYPVFVRIFQYQHPACDDRNGLLRRNAVKRGVSSNAGHLTSCPTAARVTVIAMRIEEQQKLFDTVQSQQHLRVSIGNEAENLPSVFVNPAYVRHDSNRRTPMSTHAIDYKIREVCG